MDFSAYTPELFKLARSDSVLLGSLDQLNERQLELVTPRICRLLRKLKRKRVINIDERVRQFLDSAVAAPEEIRSALNSIGADIPSTLILDAATFETSSVQERFTSLWACLVSAGNGPSTESQCRECELLWDILSCPYLFCDVNNVLDSLVNDCNLPLYLDCHIKDLLFHGTLGVHHFLRLCLNSSALLARAGLMRGARYSCPLAKSNQDLFEQLIVDLWRNESDPLLYTDATNLKSWDPAELRRRARIRLFSCAEQMPAEKFLICWNFFCDFNERVEDLEKARLVDKLKLCSGSELSLAFCLLWHRQLSSFGADMTALINAVDAEQSEIFQSMLALKNNGGARSSSTLKKLERLVRRVLWKEFTASKFVELVDECCEKYLQVVEDQNAVPNAVTLSQAFAEMHADGTTAVWNLLCKCQLSLQVLQAISHGVHSMFSRKQWSLIPVDKLKSEFSREDLRKPLVFFCLYYLIIVEERRWKEPTSDPSTCYDQEFIFGVPFGRIISQLPNKGKQDRVIRAVMLRHGVLVFPHFFCPEILLSIPRGVPSMQLVKLGGDRYILGEKSSFESELSARLRWLQCLWFHGPRYCEWSLRKVLGISSLSYAEIVRDPLLLARAVQQRPMSALSFDVVLVCLKMILLHTAQAVNHAIAVMAEKRPKHVQDSLKLFMPVARCSFVQVLVEILVEAKQVSNEDDFKAINAEIFSFIHQTFLEDSSICRTLHLQGYDCGVIPDMVANVPSMHVCIEILPQILSHYDLTKLVFAFHLLKAIVHKYSIPQSLIVAKLAFSVLDRLSQVESAQFCQYMLCNTKDCIVSVCYQFPPLLQHGIKLLNSLRAKSNDPVLNAQVSLVGLLRN